MTDMRIREIREAQGLTLQQIADRLKTNVSTVSRWERDPHRVTVPVLRDLAVALGCSPAELVSFAPVQDDLGCVPAASMLSVAYIRTITDRPLRDLAVFSMPAESMVPTIGLGALVLIDTADRLLGAGGLFGVHKDGVTSVRRFEPILRGESGMAAILADNPLFPDYEWQFCDVPVIGRVLWHGERA